MRRALGRWGGAALVLLAGATASARGEQPVARPELVVLWSDPEQLVAAAVKRQLFRDAAALFAGWGVTLRSSDGLDSDGGQDVRVVLLGQERRDERGARILGGTHARPVEPLAVWVLVPNVQAMLEQTEGGARPHLLARALAIVAAHEILHALAPGLGHASHGLMRPGLTPQDLVRPSLPVNNAYLRALLGAVRQPSAGQAGL